MSSHWLRAFGNSVDALFVQKEIIVHDEAGRYRASFEYFRLHLSNASATSKCQLSEAPVRLEIESFVRAGLRATWSFHNVTARWETGLVVVVLARRDFIRKASVFRSVISASRKSLILSRASVSVFKIFYHNLP